MTELLQLLKDFDAVGVAGIVLMLAYLAIKYLTAELVRERTEKAELVEKLEAATAARMADKDKAAEQFHTTVLDVQATLAKVAESRAAVMQAMERIARKVGAE